ncbi:MAG: alpha/beta hydrolase [Gemmobacter sp.]|uniref:alpha/beta hydrolase n=1 Tax=Gemmobacter sp. TaxID=1898957 RepID=UPI003918F1F4
MDWDRAYANGDFIEGAADYPPKWAAAAATFRDALGDRARLDLPYGPGARNRLDLFLPDGAPRGLLVFIHGGYWLGFGRESWSHLAAGPLAHGWTVAMPSYTLAPEARIAQMTREVGQAITTAADMVAGPIHVAGHSAGGHLTARMACANAPLPPAVAARIVRAVPVSPLADLGPIARTRMNESLALDAAEIAAESPAYLARRAHTETLVWVGGQERPSFLWQARLLSEEWACPWHVEPGQHHFNVIEPLADADSPLTQAVAG